MRRYFHFIAVRHTRPVSEAVYRKNADALYLEKTSARLKALAQMPAYDRLAALLQSGTEEGSLSAVYTRFEALYRRITERTRYAPVEAVGHGDAGFNNILFDMQTKTMKLVDPRGACEAEALWMDPYYDLVKLSHSVCGLYDFFNSAMYEIALDENLRFALSVPFDCAPYRESFRRHLEQNGFDYATVRIGEAALFLSMLPLHMDRPQKVLAFVLNAIQILREVEAYVQT